MWVGMAVGHFGCRWAALQGHGSVHLSPRHAASPVRSALHTKTPGTACFSRGERGREGGGRVDAPPALRDEAKVRSGTRVFGDHNDK